MATVSWKLVTSTLLLHLIFLASVFDIYFRSPLISSSKQHAPEYEGGHAPARRLILFVADGLRAESLYKNGLRNAPYLSKVLRTLGTWGVSHTKVPTESRPGHVALIAGMYEDPSAIAKGWTENPVDFDTVFNASRNTWSWGSPDILPMFAKGSNKIENLDDRGPYSRPNPKVVIDTYDAKFEDFSSSVDPSATDSWVFDKVEEFFDYALEGEDQELRLKLRDDKIILFLHLLGLDTNGHTRKPNSPEHEENIRLVDEGVKRIVKKAESYWKNDRRTAFIFTSDHGMTDWGSHGAGSDHETQTPIIAWGAGVGLPEIARQDKSNVHYNQNNLWNLNNAPIRKDINQTDVAPLMATLIGVNMPQNNVGKLPRNFLRMHPSMSLKAATANMLQIWEQFSSYAKKFEDSTLVSQPFSELDQSIFTQKLDKIKRFESKANYDAALKEVDELFDLCSRGVVYYQRYHRTKLYVIISLSYIGFILYVCVKLLKSFTAMTVQATLKPASKRIINGGTLILLCVSALAVMLQNLPGHYFVYFASSILVWNILVLEVSSMNIMGIKADDIASGAITILLSISVIETLNASFFDRRLLSLAILIMMVWQLWTYKSVDNWLLKLMWVTMCLVLLSFSFQPSVGKEKNYHLSIVAGLVGATLLFGCVVTSRYNFKSDIITKRLLMAFGASYLIISGFCGYASTVEYLQTFYINPCHIIAWTILLSALPCALSTEAVLLPRLASLSVALESIYLLLSITYEGLFLSSLIGTMVIWVLLEHKSLNQYKDVAQFRLKNGGDVIEQEQIRDRNVINLRDIPRALMFLFLSVVSFFGTGNIASLNSFDPKSIQTLVSVFNPFLMGSLLLMKVLIPFFAVSCFVCVVQKISRMPPSAMFFLVLLFSDIMGLHFFFLVTDQGSWQQIGTSLSHFVITEGIVVFLQVFWIISKYLLETPSYFTRSRFEYQK